MNEVVINEGSQYVSRQFDKVALTAGQISAPVIVGTEDKIRVAALPGGGGTLNIEYSISALDDVVGGSATWFAWSAGAVSTNTEVLIEGPIMAIRGTATTVAGAFEVLA